MSRTVIKLALSKGRILREAVPLLARSGIAPREDPEQSRKLIVASSHEDVELVLVRAADVPTYVEYGAADLGIAGKDVLMEHEGDGLYQPLDLGIARCRMVVAGRADAGPSATRLRVATKYVRTAERFFADRGVQVQVVKLYGSMELAPLAGLADRIVDLVDTGNTLRANGLIEIDTIADISARLIVNKAAMITRHGPVKALVERLEQAVSEASSAPDAPVANGGRP